MKAFLLEALMTRFPLLLAMLFLTSPAAAEIKSASSTHFEVESKTVVPADPTASYAMLGRIGEWWNPEHSYSGEAARLSLKPEPGGCFCETLPSGGFVEHGRVILAMPGTMLRLDTALGPLQGEAVSGRLTWTLKAVTGGTEITQNYIVGGYVLSGADTLAPVVDQVLSEQFTRLTASLAR